MPTVQLGTYRMKIPFGPCSQSLQIRESDDKTFLYGGIDTASIYGNEAGVGKAVRSVIAKGNRTRGEIFVQTKLWRSHQGIAPNGKSRVPGALRTSLKKLGLEYVDLWLMHWPGPGRHLSKPPVRKCTSDEGWKSEAREMIGDNKNVMVPKDWSSTMRLETWREMTALAGPGKDARAVGVCNFSAQQLERLIEFCEKENIAKPAVVQNECHPLLPARRVRDICEKHAIVFQAYASIGSGSTLLMRSKPVLKAAANHKKTPAQILLRWAVQQGMTVIPKTTHVHRLKENACIFDFVLTADEMKSLGSLERALKEQNTLFGWRRECDPGYY